MAIFNSCVKLPEGTNHLDSGDLDHHCECRTSSKRHQTQDGSCIHSLIRCLCWYWFWMILPTKKLCIVQYLNIVVETPGWFSHRNLQIGISGLAMFDYWSARLWKFACSNGASNMATRLGVCEYSMGIWIYYDKQMYVWCSNLKVGEN